VFGLTYWFGGYGREAGCPSSVVLYAAICRFNYLNLVLPLASEVLIYLVCQSETCVLPLLLQELGVSSSFMSCSTHNTVIS
jgi:hypothetical protein